MGVLEALTFDNLALRALPVDAEEGSRIRQVRRACYSRVKPTPVEHPRLVAASPSALALLDLDASEEERQEFVEVMSGNRLLPGMEPAAHCYCGHQFGNFAGQLGDGAVIYLGEVVNKAGARWEMQLKGAGLTPYSRSADGRKVLRSSIREFLASEAMHYLGIPTTRAGCITTSETRVVRDILYSGNPIQERASLVLRIAPTFFRFGSFEIFKTTDPHTGRAGPSVALEGEMLPGMLDHIICTFFPEIWRANNGDSEQTPDQKRDMYHDFFGEVVRRTAQLVAAWQCVGFCHGVLNTDNMSILGLTIDYGPYGFLERYDPNHICNHSDDSGRYKYEDQPSICYWNCEKLAVALGSVLNVGRARAELRVNFEQEYDKCYWRTMRHKLGLLELVDDSDEGDRQLIKDLLRVMADTGADFTNTFRWLALVDLPAASQAAAANGSATAATGTSNGGSHVDLTDANGASTPGDLEGCEGFLDRIQGSLASTQELAEASKPRMPLQNLRVLMQFMHNDLLFASLGATKESIQRDVARLQRSEQLSKLDPAVKAQTDRQRWTAWLRRYQARLQQEADAGAEPQRRISAMNSTNPRYVLRNWIAQQAIDAAEKGDYSEVRRVLRLLQRPFSDDAAVGLDEDPAVLAALPSSGQPGQKAVCRRELIYDGPVPQWAKGICVSCSS